jgi:signal peptidase I
VNFRQWLAGANPRHTAIRAGLLILLAYLTLSFLLLPVRGVGISMLPTIREGDLIFVNRQAFRYREPRRGEIVAVQIPGRTAVYVKRLVAVPGDRVAIDGGVLLVNGAPVDERYVEHRAPWQLPPVTLALDEFFVVGDNRGMPMAQHDMGIATRSRLIGPKAF